LSDSFGSYLERSPQAVDTVVGFLWWETLEGEENSLGLFGDQVIGSLTPSISAQARKNPHTTREGDLNQSQLLSPVRWRGAYLKPSFLYPAALAYQLANGIIHRLSHGRFKI
jgi:hypothetical protein